MQLSYFKYVTVCDLCRFLPEVKQTDEINAAVSTLLEYINLPIIQVNSLDDPILTCQQQFINYGDITRSIYIGNPVICEMNTFAEYNSSKHSSGVLSNPEDDTTPLPEVHITCLTGYDDNDHVFYARHNMGQEFGYDGYYVVPYDYIRQYGKRFITITAQIDPVVAVVDPVVTMVDTRPAEVDPVVTLPVNSVSDEKLAIMINKIKQVGELEYRQPDMKKISNIISTIFSTSTTSHHMLAMTHINNYMKTLFDKTVKYLQQ